MAMAFVKNDTQTIALKPYLKPAGGAHLDPAVDAEEHAGLVVQLLQVLSVPVEVRRHEQI